VEYFSASLASEYGPRGIHVQSQSPAFVATAMSRQKPSLAVPTAEQYARAAADAIGSGVSVVPYWSHKAVDAVLSVLPQWLVQRQVLGMHVDLRRRYLRKLEREAAAAVAGGSAAGAAEVAPAAAPAAAPTSERKSKRT
jgi:17beta-estradiol 17-dehydrogenase / very-long-chain 3-oxoacyl-CoA reductase